MTDIEKVMTVLSNTGMAMSGYQIRKATGLWTFAVYQVIGKLENQGIIEGEWDDDSYRTRRLYRLPDEGMAHFR